MLKNSYWTKYIVLSCILVCTSCANYKMHISEAAKSELKQLKEPTLKLSHQIYLIGDAGKASDSKANDVLQLLQVHLSQASKNSTVLFLGDNIYPSGLAPEFKEAERQTGEIHLKSQMAALAGFKGRPIFIPGNHDWYKYGLNGLREQEELIESTLNKGLEEEDWENYFLPDHGCPGPEAIEVNDDLVIIVIDSQWWLMDWDEEPSICSGCEVKSREAFALLFADAIKDHRNKNIVIALHHPPKSYGSHGGHFTIREHLFPLTLANKNLYLPLPGIGTLGMFARSSGVARQDLANNHYKELSKTILKAAKANGEYIFVSGHEHSLQYIQNSGQHFVVSGAGSDRTAVAKRKGALFGYGHPGFSRLDFYEDGSAWVAFYVPDEQNAEGEMVFRYQVKGPLSKSIPEEVIADFSEYESGIKYKETFPSRRTIKPMSKFGLRMLGERRRVLYTDKYNFPALDLSKFQGGMKVVKKGGGKQTNSLRLASSKGQEYVARSLTKDARRGVPYPFNQLPVVNFLFSETFLGSHPFSPPTLPPLADAANVYHTNPQLYYIPKQPALGAYNDNFGGEVYLVEERPSKKWPELASFGNAEKFISSYNMTQKVLKNHNHHVDQPWLVRSRLFDLLIGDIDRHEDQWRWTVQKQEGKNKLYRPIPRDRDNAFGTYDGLAMTLLKPYHSLVRQLGKYDESVGKFKWNFYNARQFDHMYLNQLTLEDWLKEAAYIQENITDELIESSVKLLPERAYELTGEDIIRVLKSRRDQMQELAERFYKHLAKRSIVYGSNKREHFEIVRQSDELTVVKVFSINKKGKKNKLLYDRTFKTSETKEIYIYGLDGDDRFMISGNVKKGLRLYIVGGQGADEFVNESKVAGLGKKDLIYDSKEGNILKLGKEGKDKTSKIARNNLFEPIGSQFDETTIIPIPLAGFSAGDGVKVGLKGIYHINRFNKHPYGQSHSLGVNYSFATKGVDIQYSNTFYEVAGHWDFVSNVELRNNRYSFNFFGVGNETKQEVDGLGFYRVLQQMAYLDLGLQRRFANGAGLFSFRPLILGTEITDTGNRFIDSDNTGINPRDKEGRWHAGFVSDINFDKTDNNVSPKNGFRFHNKVGWQTTLEGLDRNFTTFGSDLTFYKSLGRRSNLVLATRIGVQTIRGDYDFFFAPALGQDENIRGLYGQRFRGETAVYHTTDLRMRLGLMRNSFLPFLFGVTGSFDYGRVWQPGEESEVWHGSFGGGVWFVPLNLAVISVTYNRSDDDARFMFSLGHAF